MGGKNRVMGCKKWDYIGKKWDDGWQKWGDGWQKMGWWLAKNGMLGGKPGRRLGGKPTRSGRWQFLLAPGGSRHSDIRSDFDKKWKYLEKENEENIWRREIFDQQRRRKLKRKIFWEGKYILFAEEKKNLFHLCVAFGLESLTVLLLIALNLAARCRYN